MTVTEVGLMGVKPNHDVMNDSTPEGQILSGIYRGVTQKPGGPSRVYWGLEVEDPLKIWAFFDFVSVEQHQKFAKEFGEELVKDFPKILTKGYFSKHVDVEPFPPLVLQSPVTAITLVYSASDISQEAKDEITTRFQQFKEKVLDVCDDVKGVSYGWGVENDFPVRGNEDGKKGTLFIVLTGWPSIDAHMKFRETQVFNENIGLIKDMENVLSFQMLSLKTRSLERIEDGS